MKTFLFFLLLININLIAKEIEIKGKVIDNKTKLPLVSANVIIKNTSFGTITKSDGTFRIIDNIKTSDSLSISYLGYETQNLLVSDFLKSNKIIALNWKDYKLQSIIVRGIISKEGFTPASFSKINRKEIEENYTIQDIPEFLSSLPSTTFYSENGNGIGYNYLSIRGFDQRRISISVNGIPQNDPEDHNTYWLDMPDLLESTELIQVQRGAGAGAIGYPSIGGSINIITSPFSDKPNFELSSAIGSYNTRKYSAKFSSGLIDNKYSVYAKLSKTLSDGYRNNSWINFNSYHISAARYDRNITTQINFYGGPISDGLAFYGLPKSYIKDKKLRKTNFVQPREIENFSQPHFELLNEIKFSNNLMLNNAIFYIQGDGFFDYDGSWSIYYDDYFRLKANGFDSTQIPQNALIRAEVNNKQWGVIPRVTWEHNNGVLTSGIEYRHHRSVHWGGIRFAENIPSDLPADYKYYYYKGGNNILNFFVNENYNITEKVNILGEIQLATHKYKIFNERYLGNLISISSLYFNPRFGINFKQNEVFDYYLSYSRVTREPRLKNYYDAAESSGGAVPQFEINENGDYDFSKPLVQPETMNDFELGARYTTKLLNFNANLFYMLFDNEIVKQGQLDRFGQPITGNVDKTIHMGLEIDGNINFNEDLKFIFNGSFNKSYVSKGNTFISYFDINDLTQVVKKIDLKNISISSTPNIILNGIIRGDYNNFSFQLIGKYVGDYYSDIYGKKFSSLPIDYINELGYYDNKVDAYFVMNFFIDYNFVLDPVFHSLKLYLQVNNIFNNVYAAYASGGDFFPAAERNILGGIKLNF